MSDESHDPLRDRLTARRNRDPFVVAGPVRIARSVVRRAIARPLLEHAELIKYRQLRAEDRQNRFDDRNVDHLSSSAAGVARVERKHTGNRSGKTRDSVREPERW